MIARPGGGDGDASTRPSLTRIRIAKGTVVGGARSIKLEKGARATIVVVADAPDELHLHGYDIEKRVRPGRPARFSFEARQEGVFELESHTAEHAGREPEVARVVVGP